MCGRYTLTVQDEELYQEFHAIVGTEIRRARYNISPTQMVPVVRVMSGQRQIDDLRWGLVPPWAKDIKIGSSMINARSEEAASKPAFRSPLRKKRCMIPATGFFEWKTIAQEGLSKPKKQPYYTRRRDERVFGLAGMWDRWNAPDGSIIESCSILTTSPNDLLRSLHDRMPVIVRPEDYTLWLDSDMQDPGQLKPLFESYPSADFVMVKVGMKINSPAQDTPDCIQEIA